MTLRRVALAVFVFALVALAADMDPAIAARDRGDIAALHQLIAQAETDARQKNSAETYERVAELNLWLSEAGHVNNDSKVVKQGAQDGVAAAEKAVSLNPNSSEAHRLNGELTGELVGVVFMGGMRHGKHAGDELDKALQLDPKNAEAYVGRAIGYFFAPSTFGGSKDKAVEYLQKAIAINPTLGRAHIWLAQVYQSQGKHDEAQREINEALRIDPERRFAKDVMANAEKSK
jgi:tetratricopeptide (TPR) repeat protein